MFKCEKCEIHKKYAESLQKQVDKLTEQLIVVTDPRSAYFLNANKQDNGFDSKEYYGNEHDEFIQHNEFGEKVVSKMPTEVESKEEGELD